MGRGGRFTDGDNSPDCNTAVNARKAGLLLDFCLHVSQPRQTSVHSRRSPPLPSNKHAKLCGAFLSYLRSHSLNLYDVLLRLHFWQTVVTSVKSNVSTSSLPSSPPTALHTRHCFRSGRNSIVSLGVCISQRSRFQLSYYIPWAQDKKRTLSHTYNKTTPAYPY